MAVFSSVAKRQTNKSMQVIWYATLNSSDIHLRNIGLGHIVILFLSCFVFLGNFFIITSIVSAPVTLPPAAIVVTYFMIILLNGTKWNLKTILTGNFPGYRWEMLFQVLLATSLLFAFLRTSCSAY